MLLLSRAQLRPILKGLCSIVTSTPVAAFLICLTIIVLLTSVPSLETPLLIDQPISADDTNNETPVNKDIALSDILTVDIPDLNIELIPIEQLEIQITPAEPVLQPWLEYRIKRGDTLGKILKTIKLEEDFANFLLTKKLKSYKRLRVGQSIFFRQDDNGYLNQLLYKTNADYYLTAGKDDTGDYWAKEEAPILIKKRHHSAAAIQTSLFEAAEKIGMPDLAIEALITRLESQIDFYRSVRKGDTFRVIYDTWHDEDNTLIKMGNLYAFEYVSNVQRKKRTIQGLRRADGNFYSVEGKSLRRAFLPAPLKFRRISSKFTHRRFHPILKKWRSHKGVDYASRTGTPVRATADGVITRTRRERGYGNVVMIKHFNIYTTVYAHLSRFGKGIRRGKNVQQGQIIGYVGQTGLATGPHLHYEFRVRNVHKNPLSVSVPKQVPALKGKDLVAFKAETADVLKELQNISIGQ